MAIFDKYFTNKNLWDWLSVFQVQPKHDGQMHLVWDLLKTITNSTSNHFFMSIFHFTKEGLYSKGSCSVVIELIAIELNKTA